MAREWKALCKGVRYYETSEMMTDPNDKRKRRPIRVFCLNYRHDGKVINESIGSEDDYSEHEVIEISKTLIRNRKDRIQPFTWTDWKRERNKEIERKKEEERIAENRTFGNFYFNIYLESKEGQVKIGEISQKYYKNLKSLCEMWAIPVIGNKLFNDIIYDDFKKIVAKMIAPVEKLKKIRESDAKVRKYRYESVTEPARSITSAKTLRAILSEIWGEACDKGYAVKMFPGKKMATAEYDNKRTRRFTQEELANIFIKLKQSSLDTYHISMIAAYTGLRAGTIVKLTWQEINSGITKTSKNKTGVGLGMLRTNPVLNDILEERKKMSNKSKYVFQRKHKDNKGNTDSPLKEVSKTFSRVLEDLRINDDVDNIKDRACFHTLRHTCASMLISKGMSLEKVGYILGHKSPAMTFRYTHHDGTVYDEAAKLLSE